MSCGTRVRRYSKDEPHRKLNHSRAPAHQAGRCPDSGRHRTPDGRRDLAEGGVTLIAHGVRKIRVVEDIEQVGPELQADSNPSDRRAENRIRCFIGAS